MQSERNRNRRMSMFQKPEESKKNSSADKTEKIREIYRFLLSETDYLKEIGKEIDEETERLLKENRVNLEKKDVWRGSRWVYLQLTEAAKEKGFIQGFRYAVMLMREITVKLWQFSKSALLFHYCRSVTHGEFPVRWQRMSRYIHRKEYSQQ